MSVDETGVVDIMGTNEAGVVILTVSDHLDWCDETEHLLLLQAKLNRYLAFVESGEILEHFPNRQDLRVAFQIVFKFKPPKEARLFLHRATSVIEEAGFSLGYEVFADSYDN